MFEKTLLIGVLARDCEESIVRNCERIEELRKFFRQSYVVIVENDSRDNTKALLKEYQKSTHGVTILSEDYNGRYPFHYTEKPMLPDMSCERIARMAFHRNRLLDFIESNYDSDYIMFIDIDILDFDIHGILTAIEHAPDNWSALFANGREYIRQKGSIFPVASQYDTYALLFPNETLNETPLSCTRPLIKLIRGFQANRQVQANDYYKIKSAFGGIGIYKSKDILGIRYETIVPRKWVGHGIAICEHIPFHNQINGTCYIARNIKVTYHIDGLWNKTNKLKRKLLLKLFILIHSIK